MPQNLARVDACVVARMRVHWQAGAVGHRHGIAPHSLVSSAKSARSLTSLTAFECVVSPAASVCGSRATAARSDLIDERCHLHGIGYDRICTFDGLVKRHATAPAAIGRPPPAFAAKQLFLGLGCSSKAPELQSLEAFLHPPKIARGTFRHFFGPFVPTSGFHFLRGRIAHLFGLEFRQHAPHFSKSPSGQITLRHVVLQFGAA